MTVNSLYTQDEVDALNEADWRYHTNQIEMLEQALDKSNQREDRLERALIEQEAIFAKVLGEVPALGFPWYKDDQKNFPGATAADGVCTGELVAEDLARLAANKIKQLVDYLQLIAEGYFESARDDRFIILSNPQYLVDDGSDPLIVIDMHELKGIRSSD